MVEKIVGVVCIYIENIVIYCIKLEVNLVAYFY